MLPVCSVQRKEIIAFRYEIFCFPFRVSFQPFFILPLWKWTNAGDFICHKMDVTLNFLLQLQLAPLLSKTLFHFSTFLSPFPCFNLFCDNEISLFFLYFIIRAKRRKFNQFKCYFLLLEEIRDVFFKSVLEKLSWLRLSLILERNRNTWHPLMSSPHGG